MATDIKEAIRRLIYEYISKGADEVVATQEAVAASTTKTDKASLSLEKSFASLERRYVDTVRAQQDYEKVQQKVNAAVAQNPELQERANVVLAQARQHFDNIETGATKGSVAANALARTLTRTIGPVALIAAAVAALSSAFEFFEPIAVRAMTAIGNKFAEALLPGRNLVEDVSNLVSEFVEQARQKSEAVAAALKGVASNAQLAALNIQSMNEKIVSQKSLAENAQALERMADAAMRLAEAYPGVTLETAKQLDQLEDQLAIAKARTDQERIIAEEIAEQNRLLAQGKSIDEAYQIAAAKREISQANLNNKLNQATDELGDSGDELKNNVDYTDRWTGAVVKLVHHLSIAEAVMGRLSMLDTQFGDKQYTFAYDPHYITEQKQALTQLYGADMVKEVYTGLGGLHYELDVAKYMESQRSGIVGSQDVSSPAAASQSLSNILALGIQNGLGDVNRLIDVVSDPTTQANLVQQAIDYIRATQPPGLAREEMINELNSKLQGLISSTDSLNSTMQNALSPFYSQDPRTTHLGFRAGVVGNPEWQVGGASNENPLAAILGAGATAPGMAGGGSFMVGGGYSANDNRIAAFPVASGEEVVVNRSRKSGEGGQVIHIDNRTIINGRVDADVFAQMKVSKYQQTQRMRAGLAVA